MKKILYILPLLFLCAACAKEQPEMQNEQVPFNITIATKAGGSGSEVVPAIVNSVRVLIFNKQTAASTDPICIANEYYPFGFTTTMEEDGTTLVKVNPTIYLESPQVREYDVFVVLNEEGYTLTGGNLLNDVLSDVELNSNESAFTAILATKAVYTATTEEPAMLMSAGQTVTYTSAETPIAVHFNATTTPSSALKRTMAMISVDKIVSKPSADGTGTYDKELPKIFVLGASIENVPAGIDWDSSEDGAAGSDKVSLPLGEANANGYYDRNWEGSVYGDVAVTVKKTERTSARYYRTNESGTDGWSFIWTSHDPEATPTVVPWRYHKEPDYSGLTPPVGPPNPDDYKKEKDYNKALENYNKALNDYNTAIANRTAAAPVNAYNAAVDGITAIEDGRNSTSAQKFLNTDLPGIFDDDCQITDCQYEITSKGSTVSNIRCSEEGWSIKLGDAYYVPENISDNKTSATYINVKLALAAPTLGISGVNMADLPSPDTVNEDGAAYNYWFDHYYKKNGNTYLESINLTTAKAYWAEDGKSDHDKLHHLKNDGTYDEQPINKMKNVFQAIGHVVNADDEDIEYTSYSDVNNFHVYLDGFYRTASGLSGTSLINQDVKGVTFSWNIPMTDGTTTHVYEFKIPVNNNLDKNGDYSIHRNTKYNVTLKVGATTYGQLVTKSGEGEQALTVTATVTTEKINDNED